eukprot:scaffold35101_cov35-Attheya_sp.AAC.1
MVKRQPDIGQCPVVVSGGLCKYSLTSLPGSKFWCSLPVPRDFLLSSSGQRRGPYPGITAKSEERRAKSEERRAKSEERRTKSEGSPVQSSPVQSSP